ncbi:hydroxyacid dehydrogenase [Leifsonia sp. Root227]|uniref:D-2-hydroxyacid dehydrogenase n=1 Tax=Leifsonia sp. Root227 TaxID=1736496 RepID=UPI0006F9565B|nr:D-2-hydroxyacid dehydrogenase [Leifsonia sp. Root227]KRC51749.1 hydroxyacid dehydrogenase [Leifsonia sp. Root227]
MSATERSGRLRVFIANRIDEALCAVMTELEPRIDLLWEPDLLRPRRRMGDHHGDPDFTRSPAQQSRFETLVSRADVFFGVPDESASTLRRAVDANPSLRWVHTMAAGGGSQIKAAGLSPVQLESIVFTTSAGVHADQLAEFALLGVLAGAKDLPRLLSAKARREWEPRWPMGAVRGRTAIVVGLGNIGKMFARKASALGMRVVGVHRSATEVPGVTTVVPPAKLRDVLPGADAVVVALPGTDATFHSIGRAEFAAMRDGATFVNVGRGAVVDESALVEALEEGRIGFAALDVFETEPLSSESALWSMTNVILSPHTAALDPQEDRRIVELFAGNATRLLDGDPLVNRVNTVDFY